MIIRYIGVDEEFPILESMARYPQVYNPKVCWRGRRSATNNRYHNATRARLVSRRGRLESESRRNNFE